MHRGIDLALAQESAPGGGGGGVNSFNRYLVTLRELNEVKQQHEIQRKHANVLHETMTYLSIGGLPLGVIITSDEEQETIGQGLEIMKDILPANCFNGRGPTKDQCC